jgi:3-oxoacyl-[acyl-carrier protein] reductase
MTRLAGKVALVTHAGSGIGAVVARRLAAEGACVVISHKDDTENATRLVADIVWRGGCAMAVQSDVAFWPDVRRLFEETGATFGRLDILVNDVRTAGPATEDTRQREEINLFGAMLMSQEAIRLFGSDGGAIINLTSLARCDLAPDAAPETAIDTLTLGLARAFTSRNIRVHAIAPGALGPQEPADIEVFDRAVRSRQFVALPPRTTPDAVAKLAADLAFESGCAPLMAAS